MNNVQIVILAMSLFLNFSSVCAVCYGFYKFINKPRTTLESRVTEVEVKVKEIDASLKQGNDRFREQAETNELFISCMLSFINFEIAYCIHTGYEHDKDLIKAKETLEHYLAKR